MIIGYLDPLGEVSLVVAVVAVPCRMLAIVKIG